MNQDDGVAPETLAAQALGELDQVSGGLIPVINLSTNYEQQPDGSYRQGRVYTRADNPTSEHAERLLAALEGGGCMCVLFGSGMAAVTAVFQSLLPGDHVLVSRVLYWGVRKWLAEFALTWGLDVEFTDTGDVHQATSHYDLDRLPGIGCADRIGEPAEGDLPGRVHPPRHPRHSLAGRPGWRG